MAKLRIVLFFCFLTFSLTACAKARQGATADGFVATGTTNSVAIKVRPPLVLAGAGQQSGSVKSDINLAPRSLMKWAVFSDSSSGAVERHAHVLMATVPKNTWKFSMETWEASNSLDQSKSTIDGKYFTRQTLVVKGDEDWFSKLWAANDRDVPAFWLARRLSFTPMPNTRLTAEYREPLPPCLNEQAERLAKPEGLRLTPLDRQVIWGACSDELNAFASRGDAAFLVGDANEEETANAPVLTLPDRGPDITQLAGQAEHIFRDSTDYKN